MAFVSGVALSALAVGCGGGSLQNDAGAGSGCRTLTEAECQQHAGCAVATCSLCGEPATFAGCYDPARDVQPACPEIPCVVSCQTLDESSCRARPDCQAFTCQSCGDGPYFVGCGMAGGAQNFGCPATTCPISCARITSQATCDTVGICHSVFADHSDVCDCATPGCCTTFSGCADGAKATCAPPAVTCKVGTPICEGPYVVSYTSDCYEGCVLATECGL